MQAYCKKCRAKKEMKDPRSITMKNGKPTTQGTCISCVQKYSVSVKHNADNTISYR